MRPARSQHGEARLRHAWWLAAAGLAVVVALCSCGMPPVPVAKTSTRYDFEAGRVAFDSKRYLDAQNFLKRFLDLNPGHAVADSAQFLLGLSQSRSGAFAEAAVEFAILVREFPRSNLRDDAAYQECMAFFSQMRPAQLDPTFALRARGCFNEFLLRFPDSDLGPEARARLVEIADRLAEKEYRTALMFTNLKKYESALVYIDELLGKYPNSTWVPHALFLRAKALVRRERNAEAITTLQRLLAVFPDHAVAGEATTLLDSLRAHESTPPAPGGTGETEP